MSSKKLMKILEVLLLLLFILFALANLHSYRMLFDVVGGSCSFLMNCTIRTTTKRVHIFLEFSNIDDSSGVSTIPRRLFHNRYNYSNVTT